MTKFLVICNSGAKIARLIHCYKTRIPKIGSLILVSIIENSSNAKIARHTMCKAVVVHSKSPFRRKDGSIISLEQNAIVLLNKDTGLPLGTRIMSFVPFEIKEKYEKIVSISEGVF